MVLIKLSCAVCNGTAGVGVDVDHAEFNVVDSGGRHIAGYRVCSRCARVTR
jgi:predicted small secreted protein